MKFLAASLAKRLPVLVPIFAWTTFCFHRAVESGGGLAAFPWLIFGIAPIVLAAAISAWPIAEFIAIPFMRIYLPHVEGKPEPAYRLAEWYLEQHRFEEACREYAKILRYHPRELTARCLHIELLQAKVDDPVAARRSFRRGMRIHRNADDRQRLAQAYGGAIEHAGEDA